jgi:hypothetical protein
VARGEDARSPSGVSKTILLRQSGMPTLCKKRKGWATRGRSRQRPILLRVEPKAGHGAGKPVTKQIEEFTDVYSFLFWQLGVKQ